MTAPTNLFPTYLQPHVLTCPRYPERHPAYLPCGPVEMPCPRCRGLRNDHTTRNLSDEELREVMKTAPKEAGFMAGFGKQTGVAKWS